MRLCLLLVLVVAMGIPATTNGAQGGLIASDGFDYAGGDLSGQDGGSGFAGPWRDGGFNASIHDNFDIANGSLSYGNLATSGNSVTTLSQDAISGVVRDLALFGLDGTTEYVSFLARPEGTVGEGQFSGFFGLTFERAGTELFVGRPGGSINRFVLENRGGSGQVASTQSVVSGETTLFVLRLDYLPGNDNITLFLNPTLGDPEPAATFGTVKSDLDLLNTTGFGLYSTGAFSFDEFRLGSTFASVTPVAAVPEPGSAMGLLIVLGTALYRRRRTPKS